MIDMTIPGLTAEKELTQIQEWARQVPSDGVIVEVGSYLGLSASAWAAADPSVKIYCIDYFDYMDQFLENTKRWNNIIPIRGQSPRAIKYPGDLIDIFYLDADHRNPSDWLTIEYFLPLIKKGGLLCGHDYHDDWPDVINNTKRLEDILKQPVTLYPDSSLWSFRI